MADLSAMYEADPTLEAVDRAIEFAAKLEKVRGYVGMSAIGDECRRKLWYNFRWVKKIQRKAFLIKCAERGHMAEDQQASRLRMVDGVSLVTLDEDGKQFEYVDCDGHFCGHSDGKIKGILQAPKTLHIWEHKEREEKFYNALVQLKAKVGEKNALREWDKHYYAQAICYMHYAGIDRHYLTCSVPGGRYTTSVRTDADPAEALVLIEKARRIIKSNDPLSRISTDPEFYYCKHFCEFYDICHQEAVVEVNCRTCLHATPIEGGKWHCYKFDKIISDELQRTGCPSHLYIPSLVPGKVIEAGQNFVKYELLNGLIYTNTGE